MKYLEIISKRIFQKDDDRKVKALLNINPKRFYIENIRSYFNTSTWMAKVLCNMAVKDGYFKRKYGLMCPNCQRIIISHSKNEDVESPIHCDNCEIDGREDFSFDKHNLKVVEFFELS